MIKNKLLQIFTGLTAVIELLAQSSQLYQFVVGL